MIETIFLSVIFFGCCKLWVTWVGAHEKRALEAKELEAKRLEIQHLEALRDCQQAYARGGAEWEVVPEPVQVRIAPPPQLPARTPAPAVAAEKPGMNKWLFFGLCMLYIVCPIDIIPDFIPVLGWGDDAMALFMGIQRLMKG